MGQHDDHLDDRPQRFVARCVETWAKYRQPPELLAPAMLAHAVNLMIEDGGADEVAAILTGLAIEISPPTKVGHA